MWRISFRAVQVQDTVPYFQFALAIEFFKKTKVDIGGLFWYDLVMDQAYLQLYISAIKFEFERPHYYFRLILSVQIEFRFFWTYFVTPPHELTQTARQMVSSERHESE